MAAVRLRDDQGRRRRRDAIGVARRRKDGRRARRSSCDRYLDCRETTGRPAGRVERRDVDDFALASASAESRRRTGANLDERRRGRRLEKTDLRQRAASSNGSADFASKRRLELAPPVKLKYCV